MKSYNLSKTLYLLCNLVFYGALVQPALALSDERQGTSGKRLYQENCASCHGNNLEGQPDWKSRLPSGKLPAPPHDVTGHTWHHADQVLEKIIKKGTAAIVGGGYESDMPAFDGILSDVEIKAVLDYIKSTWPEPAHRYQDNATRAKAEAQE